MLTKVRDYILHQHLIEPGETVQVGVSGERIPFACYMCCPNCGRTCSLSWRRSMSITICAPPLTGMKILPQGSVGSGGSPAESYPWMSCPGDSVSCRGVEEAARQLRYEAFAESSAQKTALAHHMQDQAETVLMNLIRGSGTKGLAGMLPKNGNVIRPLLCCSKREIIGYMQDHGLQWVEDETNQDVEFTRNRIRHQLIRMIEEQWNPNFCVSASHAAAMLQQDEEFLSSMARAQYQRLKRERGVLLLEMTELPPGARQPCRAVIFGGCWPWAGHWVQPYTGYFRHGR